MNYTDNVTGLMWQQTADRDGNGEVKAVDKLSQSDAISYCSNLSLAGYSDWKLPDAKELQSIVDYTRSPDTTASAAINAIFNTTAITNML